MKNKIALFFVLIILSSIVLRPLHYFLIKHSYHKQLQTISFTEIHKECSFEKVWSINAFFLSTFQNNFLSEVYYTFSIVFYEIYFTLSFSSNNFRAPPFSIIT